MTLRQVLSSFSSELILFLCKRYSVRLRLRRPRPLVAKPCSPPMAIPVQSPPTRYPQSPEHEGEVTVYALPLQDNGSPSKARSVSLFPSFSCVACSLPDAGAPWLQTARSPPSSRRFVHPPHLHRCGHFSFSKRRSLHQLSRRWLKIRQNPLSRN
jgi:hypothetical protein